MNRLLAALCLLVALMSPVSARLVVNEVMVNEPGSDQSLEWIELFNDGVSPTNLGFYALSNGTSPILLPSISIPAGGYLLLCRDVAAFQLYWPDTTDRSNALFAQTTFSLANSSGTLYLVTAGIDTARFSWPASGGDGISWEREEPAAQVISPSIDRLGMTGGFVNSKTLLPRDLVVQSVSATSNQGMTTVQATIANRSVGTVSGSRLFLFLADSTDPAFEGSLLAAEDIPPVDSGFITVISLPLTIAGTYGFLGARVSADDRNRNNRIDLVVPGELFPPLVLNEALVDPEAGLFSEWVEVRNQSSEPINLRGWQLGDALSEAEITPTAYLLAPGNYLVLVQSEGNFRAFYSSFTGDLIEPASWPSLNDDGDIVRLLDPYGYEADFFFYPSSQGENFSWAFSEDSWDSKYWGRSSRPGGSPGERNETLLGGGSSGIRLLIEPRIFSPDNDGRDDSALIQISPPAADGYRLLIFDRQGRVVRRFLDGESTFRGSYSWDGRSVEGERLATGIYIVLLEAIGVESIRQTVVIAR